MKPPISLSVLAILTAPTLALADEPVPEWCMVAKEGDTCVFTCYKDWFIDTRGTSGNEAPWLVAVHAVCGSGSSCVSLFQCHRMDLNSGVEIEVGTCKLQYGTFGQCTSIPNGGQ